MTYLLKQIFGLIQLLNSETGTNQIAGGLALGIILGFSPFLSLQTFLVILILLFFRFQIGAAFLAGFFFKFVAFLIDPLADLLGKAALEAEALRGLWTFLYHAPLVPLTRFNNSIVLGSGILGVLLAIPMFFVFRRWIVAYRVQVVARIKETKYWKALQATSLYKWYASYHSLYG